MKHKPKLRYKFINDNIVTDAFNIWALLIQHNVKPVQTLFDDEYKFVSATFLNNERTVSVLNTYRLKHIRDEINEIVRSSNTKKLKKRWMQKVMDLTGIDWKERPIPKKFQDELS